VPVLPGPFGRETELAALEQRLVQRRSFLLHGAAGVGKTVLVQALLPAHPQLLYCADSSGKLAVVCALAAALAAVDREAAGVFGGEKGISGSSAVALKGMVRDILAGGRYWVVLDHLKRPSQRFAAEITEMAGWSKTPILGIARSDHMEDTGFLLSLFSGKSEKMLLRNLDPVPAGEFARRVAKRTELQARNLEEFLARAVELSEGNPGDIERMVCMARLPQYRSDDRIKAAPLYIDSRLSRR
jgi:hypothetical protein